MPNQQTTADYYSLRLSITEMDMGLVYLPQDPQHQNRTEQSTPRQLQSRDWESLVPITPCYSLPSNYVELSCLCIHFLISYSYSHHNTDF